MPRGRTCVPLEDRFWRLVNKRSDHRAGKLGFCWEWAGSIRPATSRNPKGYGQLREGGSGGGKVLLAHRVSYTLHFGPIPEGAEIDHLCHNPTCVRPSHLEAVTPLENKRRAGQRTIKKNTHCKRGHRFYLRNIYLDKKGNRHCRACMEIVAEAYQERRRLKKAA